MFGLIKEKAPLELKPAIPVRQILYKTTLLESDDCRSHSSSIIGPLYLKLKRKFGLLWKTVIYKTAVHFVAVYL